MFEGCPVNENARTIIRHGVSGFTILDDKRAASISIQPSLQKFLEAFDVLTDGILRGLDWNNLFVAGGIVHHALTATDLPSDKEKSLSSDVDLYVYGLSPMAATKKIEQIYNTWKSNLPKGAPAFILRNARTVTYAHLLVYFGVDIPQLFTQAVLQLPDQTSPDRAQACG